MGTDGRFEGLEVDAGLKLSCCVISRLGVALMFGVSSFVSSPLSRWSSRLLGIVAVGVFFQRHATIRTFQAPICRSPRINAADKDSKKII